MVDRVEYVEEFKVTVRENWPVRMYTVILERGMQHWNLGEYRDPRKARDAALQKITEIRGGGR